MYHKIIVTWISEVVDGGQTKTFEQYCYKIYRRVEKLGTSIKLGVDDLTLVIPPPA